MSTRTIQSSPKFWDESAEAFDQIYSGEKKSPFGVFLDRWLRRDIYERIRGTVNEIDALGADQKVVDIGTGTGRLCVPLARRGHHVTGVDFSEEMLKRARQVVSEAGVADRCTFMPGDLLTAMPEELKQLGPFDAVAVLGVVDYIADAGRLLKNAATLSPKKLVVSFPKAGTLRCALRRIRYKLQSLDCPLFFYRPEQICELGEKLGADRVEIRSMGQLHFTVFHFSRMPPSH